MAKTLNFVMFSTTIKNNNFWGSILVARNGGTSYNCCYFDLCWEVPQNTIALFQGATQGNGVRGELSENLGTSVGSLRRHVAASHQAEGRGRQGAGSRKVGIGGWGSQRETKKLEAVITGWAVLGEHSGKKGESPAGWEQPCGGI